ncbi:MAG: hypothetical protein K8H87_10790, partial [Pseudorhodoplanes sp.]|nr:hypothetical protein [Pseudorhodoplanes sp.]
MTMSVHDSFRQARDKPGHDGVNGKRPSTIRFVMEIANAPPPLFLQARDTPCPCFLLPKGDGAPGGAWG